MAFANLGDTGVIEVAHLADGDVAGLHQADLLEHGDIAGTVCSSSVLFCAMTWVAPKASKVAIAAGFNMRFSMASSGPARY